MRAFGQGWELLNINVTVALVAIQVHLNNGDLV